MHCPICKSEDLKIIDSRQADNVKMRRRCCKLCGEKFTTYEVLAKDYKIMQKCLEIYGKYYN